MSTDKNGEQGKTIVQRAVELRERVEALKADSAKIMRETRPHTFEADKQRLQDIELEAARLMTELGQVSQQQIEHVATQTMTPSPGGRLRQLAWDRLGVPLASPMQCRGCEKPTTKHIAGLCQECFMTRPELLPPTGLPPSGVSQPEPPDHVAGGAEPGPEVVCGMCGRGREKLVANETIVRGQAADVCTTCACNIAGCMGAQTPGQARAMMAQNQMAAAATAMAIDMMRVVGDEIGGIVQHRDIKTGRSGSFDGVLTLVSAAEIMARIARGDGK